MMLLTKEIERHLRANGVLNANLSGEAIDYKPVVKFFAGGAATWLITEIVDEGEDMNGDHDLIMFGLCDLGMGFPEMGNVSLNEMKSVRVERDRNWTANKTLTEYADAAREAGKIVS